MPGALVGLLIALGVGVVATARLRHRSPGVTPHDRARALPGDDLVPDATVVMDRVGVLSAPPEEVWPWLLQLGKGRAGWYFPARFEVVVPPRRRGLRHLEPSLLEVNHGDRVPDWGPGTPALEVSSVTAPASLVFHSLRDRRNAWRWPQEGTGADPAVLAMSWALQLDPADGDRTRLHLRVRLRMRRANGPASRLGDLVDAVTTGLLFAGLSERLRSPNARPAPGG
ncbi:hypothetical protein [Oryzihumus leptocrescens]|uniref:hypothetical protein n=1 Tax=Oryzihumus leptocrescens TaxID=297536 RepID=UPI00114F001D|nr:hypothetical protein [Oryzihumus leptocrescens]